MSAEAPDRSQCTVACIGNNNSFGVRRFQPAVTKVSVIIVTKRTSLADPNQHSNLTGLLLGAGASYDLGMPLVRELTHELKSWLTPEKLRTLNQHWRLGGPGFDYPDDVIDDLASVIERDEMQYENILGFLQVQSQRSSDALQPYNGLYAFLAEIVYALLQERHLRNSEYIKDHIRYLDGIKSFVVDNAPLWIFSLNHDLIIECFAAEFGIPIKSGFTEENIRLPRRSENGDVIGHLRAEVLPEDTIKRQGMPFLSRGQSGINLLKIHGSLDVFTFRDGRDVLKLLPDGDGIEGVLSSLRIANSELRYVEPGWPDGLTTRNEIMFADDSGEMQFLRRSLLAGAYKFDPRHHQVVQNELLDYFRTDLNYLKTLVCVGYSFGDGHINRVIREWLEFDGERHLTIVSPDASRCPSEFLHVAPQVELVVSECTDYLDQVGGIEREPIEHAARRFASWKRGRGSEAEAIFVEFVESEMTHYMEGAVELAKKLPMRDGDIDLEALDTTVEELSRTMVTELAIPSPPEVIEKFLQEQGKRNT